MLFTEYLKFIVLSLTALLAFERVPAIRTIDPGLSETPQLLSVLSEFANGAKEVIVEILTRPSDFFHINESRRGPPVLALPPPPPPVSSPQPPSDQPLELPPPESLQCPETMPPANTPSRFWRMDGSKIILELDLECVPGFDAGRKVLAWVAYWYWVLFPGGFVESRWSPLLLLVALKYFGVWDFVAWCLPRRKTPRVVVEAVEPLVIPEPTEPRDPADVYHESRLSQSYMMPLNLQPVPDLRHLRVSAPIAATKPGQAGGINATIDRIAKKEEDEDPLMVPSSLSESCWFAPGSPLSPTQSNDNGLDLNSSDGFQPKPKYYHPNDIPDMLLGSSSFVAPPPQRPVLPQFSDPWSNYTPDD